MQLGPRGQRSSYLLMLMGLSPRLPWVMTLLMPFRATILAFMMGSKSVEHNNGNDERAIRSTGLRFRSYLDQVPLW